MADVFFNGPAGRVEGKYFQSENSKAPAALVLHPHPLYGGSMNNKVVYAIYKALLGQDMSVLRINFRGVGKSQGEYDGGVGELTDAATAMDWLQLRNPLAEKFWIAGFSFGAWVAMQLIMRRPEISNFIAVSPPVNKFDFSFFSPCPVPGLIVQGSLDSIVPEQDVITFAEKLSKQKIRVEHNLIDGADHFYREKIPDLENTITEYVANLFKQGQQNNISGKKSKKSSQMLLS